ncbi:hypothetical protein MKZ17_07910 [Solibacillus sp. FSL R7-0682]|uniref:hypothetical protein n=1 Tax=Solibacillus sp. FSL R7-0682 TaxID=2921690 RepID=UPI0030FC0863
MAYEPTEWKNREVEKPRTFNVQNNADGTITLIPAEGQVTEPGTPIMAVNMNKIENQLVKLDEEFQDFNPIPSGLISMWSGAVNTIPAGWALCNGQNGTPNLLNRFIVGAGSTYAVDATGGSDTVTLTAAQMPLHSHSGSSLSTNTTGAHTHSMGDNYGYIVNAGSGSSEAFKYNVNASSPSYTQSGGNHSHSISGNTGSAGSGAAHENRPPYYALAYIMKL